MGSLEAYLKAGVAGIANMYEGEAPGTIVPGASPSYALSKSSATSSLYLRRQLIRPVSLRAKGHAAHKSEKYAHQAKAEHRQPVRHRHHNAQHVFLRLSWKKVHLLHIYYSLSYHKVIGTCLMVVLCKTDREDYKSTGLYIAEMAFHGLRNTLIQ